ncbi:hypothetical protein HDF18_13655 [Mucilaginibacter sp. X5P1]|uniref:glycoside hydrolase family 78 protein n=1 Tax=Mucilaginibacter sp. X5P1 TaxID=2723088 RepID=UPI001614D072|nr:hypothetical protein [Mucilaginibacter sp. X5P1]MBB6141939.1 hypothetical protein [Mucilaginibacter sp. X5P1]
MKVGKNLTLAILSIFTLGARSQVRVLNLRCEYKKDPMGIETPTPHLGWEIESPKPNLRQTACRILVADNESRLTPGTANIWDSGKIVTRESVQLEYSGPELKADKYYYWKVIIWDNYGHKWSSSAIARWQMGLLNDHDCIYT